MRVHSSYLLGTQTIHIESPELPSDLTSAVKLTMGKTCVLTSVALEPVGLKNADSTRLAVDFANASSNRTSGGLHREASAKKASDEIGDLIRLLVDALTPEDVSPRLRIMVRVLTADSDPAVEVAVLQGVGAAMHLLKELRVPLAVAIRAAVMDSHLILMPSETQRSTSDLDFLAVVARKGVLLLRAHARDVPHPVLIGAIDQLQESLLPVYQAVEAMGGDLASMESSAQQICLVSDEVGQVAASVEKAIQAASRFSVVSARRMALRAISTRCASRLKTAGHRFESGQVDLALQRMERTFMRQRLLAGLGRFDGRSAGDPGQMTLNLIPQVNGRSSVMIHSGRSQTCISAAAGLSMGHFNGLGSSEALLTDVFLKFAPSDTARVEVPLALGTEHGMADHKRDFFPFVSMALAPVMHSRARLAAYTTPALGEGIQTPSSAMTGVGGGCLAMLSAGTPIKAWVAGADLGLLVHGDQCLVLADPLPGEDSLLDAHLKLAGTCHGLTAVQLMANTPGISLGQLETALLQGVDLCRSRLTEMRAALVDLPNTTEPTTPWSQTMHIDPALNHEVMVRRRDAVAELCEAIGTCIRVDEHGLVTISAPSAQLLEMACKQFKTIAGDALKNGATVRAVVVEVIEFFGVRLSTEDGKVALLHSSRMTPSTLRQGLDVGDTIRVRLLGQDVLGCYRAEMPLDSEPAPGGASASF